jgi:hypothetical protein
MQARIHSIDAIRGYCLINILINHITSGILHNASPSNFGFSDSAELFVFLSGLSTFLAFGKLEFKQGWIALWRRAGKLYKYNIAIIFTSLAGLLLIAGFVNRETMLSAAELNALNQTNPLVAAWHLLTMRQSVGYSMVLRLYTLQMLAAPLLIWLAARRWWLPLPPVIALWAAAGHFHWIAPNSLTGIHLTITILPWTLVFTCGLAMGAAIVQGVRPPVSRLVLSAASALVLGYLVLLYAIPFWPAADAWAQTREDHFWFGSSKALESPVRVLHLLSLVYIFTVLPKAPLLRLVHQTRPNALLARLGRKSLPVFTFTAIYTALVDEILHQISRRYGQLSVSTICFEVILVTIALLIMFCIATERTRMQLSPPRETGAAPSPTLTPKLENAS